MRPSGAHSIAPGAPSDGTAAVITAENEITAAAFHATMWLGIVVHMPQQTERPAHIMLAN